MAVRFRYMAKKDDSAKLKTRPRLMPYRDLTQYQRVTERIQDQETAVIDHQTYRKNRVVVSFYFNREYRLKTPLFFTN